MARLAIADPPYPPLYGERHDTAAGLPRLTTRSRAVRWYGNRHPAAAEWDSLDRHRRLLLDLVDGFDGFALATTPDGLGAYHPLPAAARILVWVRPNAIPSNARILSMWEAVIVLTPPDRRRRGAGAVRDVLTCPAPGRFPGAKPAAWTRWILDALGYDPDEDELLDLFPGSGAVANAASQGTLYNL